MPYMFVLTPDELCLYIAAIGKQICHQHAWQLVHHTKEPHVAWRRLLQRKLLLMEVFPSQYLAQQSTKFVPPASRR